MTYEELIKELNQLGIERSAFCAGSGVSAQILTDAKRRGGDFSASTQKKIDEFFLNYSDSKEKECSERVEITKTFDSLCEIRTLQIMRELPDADKMRIYKYAKMLLIEKEQLEQPAKNGASFNIRQETEREINQKAESMFINIPDKELNIDEVIREVTYELREKYSKYYEDFEKAIKESAQKAADIVHECEEDENSGIGKLCIQNRIYQNALIGAYYNHGITEEQMGVIRDCLEDNIKIVADGNYDKNELAVNLIKADITSQIIHKLDDEYYEKRENPRVYGTFGEDISGISGKDLNTPPQKVHRSTKWRLW